MRLTSETAKTKLEIEIPETILSRNRLDTMHWSKRYRYSQKWEALIWRAFNCKPPRARGKVKLKITSLRPGILDHDNLVGGCKGIIDAMKRLGMLIDDTPSFVEVEYQQRKAKREEQRTKIDWRSHG